MAASRNASTNTNNGASTAPLRISFAKIKEPLEVPNLLALQTESFDWLLGNAAWKARVEAALESGQDVPTKSGLEEIFEEISSDRGLLRVDVADLPRPPLRAAEELDRRVQGP
ncbi:hypothetical protein STANM309S_03125 [Streptomyces tanashiensis]